MKATKKPITIEYYPAEEKYKRNILAWSTEERPIIWADMQKYFEITTMEGVMRGNENDVIIKGVNGEVYPCKKDIFYKTYKA